MSTHGDPGESPSDRLLRIDRISIDGMPTGKVTRIDKLVLQNENKDGSRSKPYNCDAVSHSGIDAIGFLPYWKQNGEWQVMLVETLRPALTVRPDPLDPPFLLEIIAGVMEKGETGEAGIKARTVAEALEEGGLILDDDQPERLGNEFFSSPGVYTEKIYLMCAEVDPARKTVPTKDGSVMEDYQQPVKMSLGEAKRWCDDGRIRDAKTEIAIRRLCEKLGGIESGA